MSNRFKYIPLGAGLKTPIEGFSDWQNRATDDPAQIQAWRDAGYNLGIACGPSGIAVVDLDGPAAEAHWFELQLEHGFVETQENITRKGRHVVFSDPDATVPNSVKKIGPHTDTRGQNGYIVAPGSIVGGVEYRTDLERPLQPFPQWARELLARSREAVAAPAGTTLDTDIARGRAAKLLSDNIKRDHVAREGEGGDALTYAVCCEVLDLGLTPPVALDVMQDWNAVCVPPWSDDELLTKLNNAHLYSQNADGAWAVSPTTDRLDSEALDMLAASAIGEEPTVTVGERASRFAWMGEDEFQNMAPPVWLLDDMLIERSLAVLFGKSGHFKSFIALGIGARIAQHGRSVFYVAGEGINRMARGDYPAWKLAHGEMDTLPFYMMEDMPEADSDKDYLAFAESIKAKARKPVGLIVLDTLNRAMAGLDENSAKDVSAVLRKADWLRKAFGCTVLIIHHTGDGDPDKMRGSSAIRGYVDTVLKLKSEPDAKIARLWVDKQKNAPERSRPWCFEGKKFGPGMAFVEIDQKEAADISGEGDIYAAKYIGAVLGRLGAYGEDNGVTTHILARELVERASSHTDASWADAVGKMQKGLAAAAKGKANAYAWGEGRTLIWWMPGRPVNDF